MSPLKIWQKPNKRTIFEMSRTTNAPNDLALAKVAAAWSTLPPAVKAGIVAMVQAFESPGDSLE